MMDGGVHLRPPLPLPLIPENRKTENRKQGEKNWFGFGRAPSNNQYCRQLTLEGLCGKASPVALS
jgi:hypothetical protein